MRRAQRPRRPSGGRAHGRPGRACVLHRGRRVVGSGRAQARRPGTGRSSPPPRSASRLPGADGAAARRRARPGPGERPRGRPRRRRARDRAASGCTSSSSDEAPDRAPGRGRAAPTPAPANSGSASDRGRDPRRPAPEERLARGDRPESDQGGRVCADSQLDLSVEPEQLAAQEVRVRGENTEASAHLVPSCLREEKVTSRAAASRGASGRCPRSPRNPGPRDTGLALEGAWRTTSRSASTSGRRYSCVSIVENGEPVVLPNEWGEVNHASVVSFLEDGTVLVGNSAKRNIITHAESTVYSAKRLIGRYFFSDEVKKAMAVMPYRIAEGENNSVRIQVRDQLYSPSRDLRARPQGDEGHRRAVPRPSGDQGGHHRPRLLQRQPAPGHQGRGPHRRAERPPHPERAHRGGAGLRVRARRQPAGRGLRPRRRHVRRLDPRDRQGRLRGALHRRRHLPRRRRLRRPDHDLAGRRLPRPHPARPPPVQVLPADAEGGRGAGEDRRGRRTAPRTSSARTSARTRRAR